MELLKTILSDLAFVLIMLGISYLAYKFYNILPPAWFMPTDEPRNHMPANPRIKKSIESIVYIFVLTFLGYMFFIQNEISLLLFCNILTLLFLSYVFVSDIKTYIIPNQFTFVLIFLSLFWILNDLSVSVFEAGDILRILSSRFIGGIIGGVFLLLLNLVASKLLKQESIGMGDVKLLFASGLIVTSQGIMWVIIMSFLLAFPIALYKQIKGQGKGKIPFGPFIALATILFLQFPTFLLSISTWWFYF